MISEILCFLWEANCIFDIIYLEQEAYSPYCSKRNKILSDSQDCINLCLYEHDVEEKQSGSNMHDALDFVTDLDKRECKQMDFDLKTMFLPKVPMI